ncbi:MAG: exodeoxyribonuclease VII large subunit [Oxalicibacterium faecigallinarum]|uniref:exodeoxyribonuclease VII large subunit n=1 Tax=Oxalicibacterium faecigallinarum TaxID=573741 RepID=UPI00280869A3|nr:exodeoxyribonuclease VII large subunit [Oxalicibacterium faecigallinarum]MDQ7970774.1 exodeoxyribonuclease VII large subunit [Oxalicibacterium faecigallinarum]
MTDSTSPTIVSVSALNQAVARMLEKSFPLTWISGEISNFTRAASGHWYFTLKDDAAQVRAVMFRGRAQYADFSPREGDKVEVRALVTLYAPRGDYQLNVEAIRRAGVGNLYEAFLQLKEKLNAEGLFDPARKRTLPSFVRTIGIVTSPQAAALRDVLTTLQRRAPHVKVILYPTPVQGEGAALKIAQAIATASARAECDVLLVCRGGGSIEDLWSFNHEIVARTIVGSDIPVIAGIGHETDFTIADFAADVRAPTPTAAAELATLPRADWLAQLDAHAEDLRIAMKRRLSDATQTLDWMSRRLISPSAYINQERARLGSLQNRLQHATRIPIDRARLSLTRLTHRWQSQQPDTRTARLNIARDARSLFNGMQSQLKQRHHHLRALSAQLEMLNPQRTLERGYAIVSNEKGEILRSPQSLQPRSNVTVRLAEGTAQVGIASVQKTLE